MKNFGIVCDFLPASLEGWTHFDYLLERYDGTPINFKYDRRYVGFPELNDHNHLTEFILPRWYEFNK